MTRMNDKKWQRCLLVIFYLCPIGDKEHLAQTSFLFKNSPPEGNMVVDVVEELEKKGWKQFGGVGGWVLVEVEVTRAKKVNIYRFKKKTLLLAFICLSVTTMFSYGAIHLLRRNKIMVF